MLTTALSLGAAVSEAISRVSKAHQEALGGDLFLVSHLITTKGSLLPQTCLNKSKNLRSFVHRNL